MCKLKGSLFICEKKLPLSPPLRTPGSCPTLLNVGIFGACLFIQAKGVSKRAQTQITPLPPALRETHSQVMCCFPEINTSGPLHKSGCPHLITSIHATLKLKRSLKTTGTVTLFYVWRSGNPVVSRTWPRSTRQTRDWGSDTLVGYSDLKPHLKAQLLSHLFSRPSEWHILF